MSSVVIEAKTLTKTYDSNPVVDGVDLQIHKGECFGLLGPNGAGKTSAMRMMYCSATITSGELFVLGLNAKKNAKEIKSRVGIVPQDDGLESDFTTLDNLLVYSSYFSIDTKQALSRAQDMLRLVRLEDSQYKKADTLSGGMKRRLVIARALMNEPEVLFLDEPTTGLDPQARIWIWENLKRLKADGVTQLLTTHYMEEAEALCDRVAIMDNGKVLTVGQPAHLIEEHIGREVVEIDVKTEDISYYVGRLKANFLQYQVIENRIALYLRAGQSSQEALKLVTGSRITIRKPHLNDVFLKLAGHELRD